MISYQAIGVIRTPYIDQVPERQPVNEDREYYIELKDQYIEGLQDLDEFNYIHVLFHLDRISGEAKMKAHPPKLAGKEIGLFASRSPHRPNPIGLSTVEIVKIEKNRIYITGIDTLDKTPVIDIKPYIKELDCKLDAISGWVENVDFKDNKSGGGKEEEEKIIHLYTDGACAGNPGPGGYAALVMGKGMKEREVAGYEPDTTNNRMELRAVIEGLKSIDNGAKIKIYSDSNYVIKGITEWMNDWRERGWKTASNKPVQNKDLWVEFNKLLNNYQVEFIKVKGHSGNKYNEKVDKLAKEQIELNQ